MNIYHENRQAEIRGGSNISSLALSKTTESYLIHQVINGTVQVFH